MGAKNRKEPEWIKILAKEVYKGTWRKKRGSESFANFAFSIFNNSMILFSESSSKY